MLRSTKNKKQQQQTKNRVEKVSRFVCAGHCSSLANLGAWEGQKTSKYFTLTLNMTLSVYICVTPIDCSQQGALFQLRQDKQRVLRFITAVEIKRPLMIRQCQPFNSLVRTFCRNRSQPTVQLSQPCWAIFLSNRLEAKSALICATDLGLRHLSKSVIT